MVVPDHLPETRTIAIATQRFGPTKEDVCKIRGYRTKLFADTIGWSHTLDHSVNDAHRSERHDFEFQRMLLADEGKVEARALSAMRGLMAGIWDGFYLVSGALVPQRRSLTDSWCGLLGQQMGGLVMPASGTIGHERQLRTPQDFRCRKPLQAVFTEFVCLDNSESNLPSLDDISGQRNLLKSSSQIEVISFLFPSRQTASLISHPRGGSSLMVTSMRGSRLTLIRMEGAIRKQRRWNP